MTQTADPKANTPIVWWEVLIIVLLILPAVFNWSQAPQGLITSNCGAAIGRLMGILLIPIIYFLCRKRYSRLRSFVTLFLFIFVIGIIAALSIPLLLAKRAQEIAKAPIALHLESINSNLSLLAPTSFKETTLQASNSQSPVSIKGYASNGNGLTITAEFFEMSSGYYFIVDKALKSKMDALKSKCEQFTETKSPSPFSISGYQGFRGDANVVVRSQPGSSSKAEVIVLAFSNPPWATQPSKGIIVTLVAEAMPPDKCIRELERVIASIELKP